MPATIIDALVVTLGLDGGPYKKAAREAAQEQSKLKDSVKKGANEVSGALAEVGRQAALLFLGFEGIKGAISFFGNLNAGEAALGRFSKNLGESAHEVNTWDSAVELAGGSAKNAEADLMGLSNSITALKATGDVSPLLLLFQRMGVAITDSSGKARKLTDLMKDLGDKLRQYNRADAFNLGRQAGLSEDTLNLILQERGERERLLSLAEQNNKVTDDTVKKAQELQEEWRGIGQSVRNVGVQVLSFVTPYVKEAFEWVQKIFTGVANTGFLQGVFTALGGAIRVVVDLVKIAWSGLSQLFDLFANTKAGKFLGDLLSKFGHFAKEFGKEFVTQADKMADNLAPEKKLDAPAKARGNSVAELKTHLSEAEKKYGIPAGVLTNIANTESHFRPDIISGQTKSKVGATGLMQLRPQYFPGAGKDPHADIETAAKYLQQLYQQFGDWTKAVAAFNDGPGNVKKIIDGQKALPQETANYIKSVLGANPDALTAARFANASGVAGSSNAVTRGGGTTTVDIGEVNIVAPNARNAADVAAEIPGALKRKGVVAQADTGMS